MQPCSRAHNVASFKDGTLATYRKLGTGRHLSLLDVSLTDSVSSLLDSTKFKVQIKMHMKMYEKMHTDIEQFSPIGVFLVSRKSARH